MFISVVIPAFNEETFLQFTIEQIECAFDENKEEGLSWEIIVCDNNSTDGTGKVAAEMGAKVTFEPINNIARARNTGAVMAQGEWLLFIDADSVPMPELMAEVLAVIHSDAYIGCGTTILVGGGTLFNKLRMERMNPFYRVFNFCGGAFVCVEFYGRYPLHFALFATPKANRLPWLPAARLLV